MFHSEVPFVCFSYGDEVKPYFWKASKHRSQPLKGNSELLIQRVESYLSYSENVLPFFKTSNNAVILKIYAMGRLDQNLKTLCQYASHFQTSSKSNPAEVEIIRYQVLIPVTEVQVRS